MDVSLSMTEAQLDELYRGLFPGDGLEAAAMLLCGRHEHAGHHRLMVHRIEFVPASGYALREANRLEWRTDFLPPLIKEAHQKGLGLFKVHSHPSGYAGFSSADDRSDAALFPSLYGWLDDGLPLGSGILLPDRRFLGRVHREDEVVEPLRSVVVAGSDITVWTDHAFEVSPAGERNAQAFGEHTYNVLRGLRIAVVGCSGTGSWLVELLARLEVGELVLVDFDTVEEKNLNRIAGAGVADIGRLKVDVLSDHVARIGLGTKVFTVPRELTDANAWTAVAGCDMVFGCLDSVDGRHVLNRLATFYTLPYFDVGVRLISDGGNGIEQMCGTVHYLQPGGSSLLTRGLYTDEGLRAANLRRADPAAFEAERAEKYVAGVDIGRPAVAPTNMFYSAFAVLDFLARLHPYRLEPNSEVASFMYSLSALFHDAPRETEYEPDHGLERHVGRGDAAPPLGLPILSLCAAP